jgi:hypothetical protein
LLGGPTLINLAGSRDPALFVSVLMHGNETSGWYAVQALLKKYYQTDAAKRPRSLSLFIANTQAAQHGVRHLPDQPDFNRVWPGSDLEMTPEHWLMQGVHEMMRQRGVFASVDIHNNTGLNPHYACVNNLHPASLKLATLFGRTVVYFIRPLGVQSMAMSELCPAVTLECGKSDQEFGIEHALTYLDACVHMIELPNTPVAPHDIDLFHTTATVKVPDQVSFGFQGDNLGLTLPAELERYNFRELAVGTTFGNTNLLGSDPLLVCSETGEDVFDEYFELQENTIRSRKAMMPSMLTSDLDVIRQDCLCYLMERYTI